MANKKFISNEKLDALVDAREGVVGNGTMDWLEFNCACYYRNSKGNWVFLGWYPPRRYGGYIKVIRGVTYLYFDNEDGTADRYALSDKCMEVLGLAA